MAKKATKKSERKSGSPRAKRPQIEAAGAPEEARGISEAPASPSLEQIRDRAYEIFRSGANPRDPLADWFQAERELGREARP
jgi:hypothetical protein